MPEPHDRPTADPLDRAPPRDNPAEPRPARWVHATVGAKVEGIVERQTFEQARYGTFWVLHLRQDDGREIGIWLTPTVLRAEVERLSPRKGDYARIVRVPSPPGKRYFSFLVHLWRPGPDGQQVEVR